MLTASPWLTTIAPAAALGIVVGLYGIIHPRARIWGPVISRASPTSGRPSTRRPRVALTFDDGPTPQSTPAVLDALERVNAPATFFVVGRNVREHPHLLARIHARGHLIANHSFTHPRQGLWGLRTFWRKQLDACDDAIFDLIGRRPTFFRPPMGLKHWHMLKEVTWSGQTCVTWTRRARDTNPRRARAAKITKRLTKNVRDGDILLLHDGHEPGHPGTRQATADAVLPLVNQLRDRGFDLVRLDELLDQPGYFDVADEPALAPADDVVLPSALERR